MWVCLCCLIGVILEFWWKVYLDQCMVWVHLYFIVHDYLCYILGVSGSFFFDVAWMLALVTLYKVKLIALDSLI